MLICCTPRTVNLHRLPPPPHRHGRDVRGESVARRAGPPPRRGACVATLSAPARGGSVAGLGLPWPGSSRVNVSAARDADP
jgi:hypothetical protein